MAEQPQQFPLYRFFADGRSFDVENQVEADALDAPADAPTRGVAVSDTPPDASGLTAELAQESTRRRARQRHEAGASAQAIADALGVTVASVQASLEG